MSAPASAPQMHSLDGTLGCIVVGLVLGTFLFGMLTVQVFNYSQSFPKDTLVLKSLGYTTIVTFYGQPEHIANPPGSFELLPLFSGLVALVVESFFAFRIRTLSGRWVLTAVCIVLNTVAFVLSVILVVLFYRARDFATWEAQNHALALAASSLVPINNILITTGLCYYLWTLQRLPNRLSQTRTMINSLMLWTVENTVIISAASFFQLIFLLTRKDLVWIVFFLLHGKLLSNCMVAS
ncbi:hypothetical protein C8R46DRAFT_1190592 [Mycena filopes]|nr:hypothetical protein C8R46DRAFT_1190592 [Mycena filopes]